jgi:hypothetical protein
MAEEFAVKIRDNAHIYIHNTLENAAWYLKEKIEARKRAGNVCFQCVRSTGQCNTACSLSAGVWKPKVFRGR